MSDLTPDLLREIFDTQVLPYLLAAQNPNQAAPDERPWFVSVGGQPGAGKSGVIAASGAEHPGSIIVDGDALRRFHPKHDTLMATDPLAMPDATAQASGAWVQFASQWLREHRVSAVIETTLRQKDFLIREFASYRAAGFATELRVVAVPLEVSRLGTLARYVGQAQRFGAGRSVTLQGHDDRAALVPETVEGLVAAGVVDRLVIQDRDGKVFLDVDASAGDPELAALARAIVDEHRAPSSMTLKQAQGWFAAAATTIAALQGVPIAPDLLTVTTRIVGPDAEAIAPIAWLEAALQQERLLELHALLKVVTRARTAPRIPLSQRLRRTPSRSVPELEL